MATTDPNHQSTLPTLTSKKVARQSLLALLASGGSLLALFLWLLSRGESLVFSLPRPLYLGMGALLLVLAWLVDATRLFLTVRAWKKPIPFRQALIVVLLTHFFAHITPSSAGGGVIEIYLLHRLGFTWGEAGSLSLSCGILYQVGFVVLFLVFLPSIPSSLFAQTLLVIFLVYSLGLTLIFFLARQPLLLSRVIGSVLRLPKGFFPTYVTYYEESLAARAQTFLTELQKGFTLIFWQKFSYFLLNLSLYALHSFCLFSITYFIILALGLYLPLETVIQVHIPPLFLFRLTPTPGGSGGVELSLVSAFTPFLGEAHAGTVVFLWRIFTYYALLGIGGFLLFHLFKKDSSSLIYRPLTRCYDERKEE